MTYAPSRPVGTADWQQRRSGRPSADIKSLPSLIGNRAFTSAVMRAKSPSDPDGLMAPGEGGAEPTHVAVPAWSHAELRAIQAELKRLGLYTKRLDGRYGPGTQVALVEAFGGNEWRYRPVPEVTERLQRAKQTGKGSGGEHRLRYGEMFRDGVLDVTVAIGFDELGRLRWLAPAIRKRLVAMGFKSDRAEGLRLMHMGGHDISAAAPGDYLIRPNALTYSPPAGDPRRVDAVVRVVDGSAGNEGAADAAALAEGIKQSDVTASAGHGRYGSGPDFDQSFEFVSMVDDSGAEVKFEHYGKLWERLCKDGQAHGRSAWQQFLWLDKRHRVTVRAKHEGNLLLNPNNQHSNEFGAQLMYWTMKRDGKQPVTGKGGGLATNAVEQAEHPYRVVLFDGCNTRDYVSSIRRTPGMSSQSADIIASNRVQDFADYANTVIAFLSDVIGQQSAEQILRDVNAQERTQKKKGAGDGFEGSGFGDNAVVPENRINI